MLVTEQSYGALGKLEATDEVTLSVVIGVVVSAFVVPLSGIGEVAIGAELTELRITNSVRQKQNKVMMNVVTVIQTDDLEVLQLSTPTLMLFIPPILMLFISKELHMLCSFIYSH